MIIAVDFDGVIVEDKFPDVGEPDMGLVGLLNKAYNKGHSVILWTSRVDDKLEAAVETCKKIGLSLTAVNNGDPGNVSQYGTDPRKIYADIYLDDRALGFSRYKAYITLTQLITKGEYLYEQR
jgi:hypothetical protein